MKFSEYVLNNTNTIAQREILVILIAVRLWAKDLAGKVVRFSMDNENALFAINKGRSKDPFVLQCTREIAWLTCKFNILLKAVYINTKNNILPDALSRWYQTAEARRIVRQITKNKWIRRSVSHDMLMYHYNW